METTVKATTDALKDLVLLNNDRCEGYEKALTQTDDNDLKQLFSHLSGESKKFSEELKAEMKDVDNIPDSDETTNSGKLYRVWMDIKSALTSDDRKSVLASCEYGEDVIKKAYQDALKNRDEIAPTALAVIERQYSALSEAHNRVKHLRDSVAK